MLETLLLAATISMQVKADYSMQVKADHYCYRQTPSGQIIDMAYMCPDPPVMETVEPPPPPQPPVILSDGNLECSFLGDFTSSRVSGAGETISIPAACVALRTTSGASVRAQIKADNRVLGTHTENISYIEVDETYYYDATFSSDYASDITDNLSIRFIP